ncbi:MAG TPA: cysteine desulfurase family protein [Candidatus Binatia bacterium]|nr:cysteine desulfurase family protein [Candidatus Binatia bacterium]
MKKKRIYFDNAATTPLDKKVAKAMAEFEASFFGNPNSIHYEGQQARAKIDFARAEVAEAIFAKPQEIIFTSGATEANNLAIKGVISFALAKMNEKPHVVTTTLEHQSVYNVVKEMEKQGIIEATYVKPNRDGIISAEDVIRAIKDNTVLVSVIFVSNEIGTVLPVRQIGKHIEETNAKLSMKIYFHTDAVQALKYYNCHVEKLGVDLMTLSAHKINGPKGVGALYVKTGTKLARLMEGGSQEYGMRPGTQNTAGIIGFAEAIKTLKDFEAKQKIAKKMNKLAEKYLKAISKLKNIEINGPMGEDRSPDNINFTIKGMDQETAIAKFDLAGFAVSTGSACVSGSSEPSHVILSLNKGYKEPSATVRVSLGKQNTEKELGAFLKILETIGK